MDQNLRRRNATARGEPKVVLKSLFLTGAGGFSPDGRWIVYLSEESGRPEIYVRASSGEERKWSVSTEGGIFPVRSPAGNEIFYLSGMTLLAVPVGAKGDEFVAGDPKVLFENHEVFSFAATHDGRFPSESELGEIPDSLWRVPGYEGLRFRYVPGRKAATVGELLVVEPELDPQRRLVILTDGEIATLTTAEIQAWKPHRGAP
jgi:hypothetical protein